MAYGVEAHLNTNDLIHGCAGLLIGGIWLAFAAFLLKNPASYEELTRQVLESRKEKPTPENLLRTAATIVGTIKYGFIPIGVIVCLGSLAGLVEGLAGH